MSSSSSRVVHTPELFISIFFCYQFLFQFLHKSVRPGSSTRFSLRSADVRKRCLLLAHSGHFAAEFQCPLLGAKRTSRGPDAMSASLIGRLGSSAFRLSATAVSMSLAGSCFSPDSALGPFHHGIRGQGGTIF